MPKGRAVLVLLLLLGFSLPLLAQNTTVRGRVTLQADGSALPGVTISAVNDTVTAVTDSDGRYVLSVPSNLGSVQISALLSGFRPQTSTVDVSRGGEATHDFSLVVAFGQEITIGSRAIGAAAEKAVPV